MYSDCQHRADDEQRCTPVASDHVTDQVPAWAVWSLRTTALLASLLVLTQAVLAGLFVTGDVGMLELHSVNAGLVISIAFLQLIAAVLVWRPGRGAVWPIWASAAVFALAEAQAGFGYARLVSAHIPLGVALFGASVGLLVGVFSPRIRARRRRGPSSTEDRT
jgi:hypothetical protein